MNTTNLSACQHDCIDRIRNETVRGGVHVGRRLIQDEHLVPPQDGPGQADELRLARRQVRPALTDPCLQAGLRHEAGRVQLDPREGLEELQVFVLAQGVQVPAIESETL